MGWFWSDDRAQAPKSVENKFSPYFWVPQKDSWDAECPIQHTRRTDNSESKCPISKNNVTTKNTPEIKKEDSISMCPVKHAPSADVNPSQTPETSQPSQCPVNHEAFNKFNNMPHLDSAKLPGQTTDLPTERTISSIPKGSDSKDGFWEYPSPQQMLTAMVRKDRNQGLESDIDETAVESMVNVHNFLNEGVWEEVLQWEKKYSDSSHMLPRLLRFKGRPNDLSPRARMIQALGSIMPSKFGVPPPFDRHDWTVLRAVPAKEGVQWKQVRYVIDFYEVPGVDDDSVFTVDVRPAADSLGSILDRIQVASGEYLHKNE